MQNIIKNEWNNTLAPTYTSLSDTSTNKYEAIETEKMEPFLKTGHIKLTWISNLTNCTVRHQPLQQSTRFHPHSSWVSYQRKPKTETRNKFRYLDNLTSQETDKLLYKIRNTMLTSCIFFIHILVFKKIELENLSSVSAVT